MNAYLIWLQLVLTKFLYLVYVLKHHAISAYLVDICQTPDLDLTYWIINLLREFHNNRFIYKTVKQETMNKVDYKVFLICFHVLFRFRCILWDDHRKWLQERGLELELDSIISYADLQRSSATNSLIKSLICHICSYLYIFNGVLLCEGSLQTALNNPDLLLYL